MSSIISLILQWMFLLFVALKSLEVIFISQSFNGKVRTCTDVNPVLMTLKSRFLLYPSVLARVLQGKLGEPGEAGPKGFPVSDRC